MRVPRWKITLVALGTAGALAMIPMAVSAVTQTFSDVPPSDWAFEDIEWLATEGLTNGCGDGTTFCPDDPVSRREMAAFTHRLATSEVVDAGTVEGMSAADLAGQKGEPGDDGPTGPQGPAGPPGPAGQDVAAPIITVLRQRDGTPTEDNSVTLSYEQLTTIGTFTKVDASTVASVRFVSHVAMVPATATGGGDPYDFCDFQIRIDGITDSSNESQSTGRIVLLESVRGANDLVDAPGSTNASFGAIAAGLHDVQIWVRGIADTCSMNRGGWYMQAVVEEHAGVVIQPNP